jgi:cold shock CspA family protein
MAKIEGRLLKWSDDRGFGFIEPRLGGSEIFVHVSAFPRDGQRPVVGESLSFEVEMDAAGKKRAVAVERPLRAGATRAQRPPDRLRGTGFPGRLLSVGLIVAVAYGAYHEYGQRAGRHSARALDAGDATESMRTPNAAPSTFRCDGREHCSQMTSCAEAKMFLEHCPGMKMDGDNDRIPCEDTLCAGPWSR